jgi:uncharacterized protein YjiS (DUF1127 family)
MDAVCTHNAGDSSPAEAIGSSGVRRDRLQGRLQKFWACRSRVDLVTTLSALADYQLDDLGMRRDEIQAYARAAPHAPRLLGAMLEELEIAREWVEPRSQAYDELLKNCSVCPEIAACRRWLLSCGRPDGYRAFCPNVALLDKLPRWSGTGHPSGGPRQEPRVEAKSRSARR